MIELYDGEILIVDRLEYGEKDKGNLDSINVCFEVEDTRSFININLNQYYFDKLPKEGDVFKAVYIQKYDIFQFYFQKKSTKERKQTIHLKFEKLKNKNK